MARGLGALTSGFQQGYGFSAGARRERQLDKLYKLKEDEMLMGRAGQIEKFKSMPGYEEGQLEALGISESPDMGSMTFAEKIGAKFRSWTNRGQGGGGGDPAEQVSGSGALPAGSESQEEEKKDKGAGQGGYGPFADGGAVQADPVRGFGGPVRKAIDARKRTHTPDPVASYGDGGRVPIDEVDPDKLSPEAREQLRRQQAADRTRVRGNPERGPDARRGPRYRPAQVGQTGNAPLSRIHGEPVSQARTRGARLRAGAKQTAKKGALPVAAGLSAIDTYGTGTDEYRRRYEGLFGGAFEHEEDDWGITGLGKDMAVRGIGAMEDFGNTLLEPLSWVGLREGHGRYDEEGAMGVDPAAGAALEENLPPPPEDTAQTPSEEDPPGTAPAREAMFSDEVQLGGDDGDLTTPDQILDLSSEVTVIPPDEIPRHTTDEWAANRDRLMRAAVLMGDDPFEVAKQVTENQIMNFNQYALQAQHHIVRGDLMGAARAMTVAYQYFPNGSDVSFGMQKGKDGKMYLVGLGKDEKTGEVVGTPQLITEQTLGRQIEASQNPDVWQMWTKDMHELELKYKEFDLARDEAEHRIAIGREDARSRRIAAEAAETRAWADMYGGGEGSLPTYSQVTAAEKEIKNDLRYEGTQLQLTPDQTTQVSGLIADIYAKTGIHYGRLTPLFVKGMEEGMSPEQIYQAILQDVSGQAIEAP